MGTYYRYFNSVDKHLLKADQRPFRDHLTKLLTEYTKKSTKESASGIAPVQTQLPLFLEEVTSLKNHSEILVQQEAETKSKQAEQDIWTAKEICKLMERWSETKKHGELQKGLEETPRKRWNNGSGTVNCLREKSEAASKISKSELQLKRQELQLQREPKERNNIRNEKLLWHSQQQYQSLLMVLAKIAEKI